nr:unnamed protein product [Naegleria fowleri]
MQRSSSSKFSSSLTSPQVENKRDSHQDEFYDNYFSYYTNKKESEQNKYRILMNCLYWFGFSSDIYFGYVKLELASVPPIIPLVSTFFIPCTIFVFISIASKCKSLIMSYRESKLAASSSSTITHHHPTGKETTHLSTAFDFPNNNSSTSINNNNNTSNNRKVSTSKTPSFLPIPGSRESSHVGLSGGSLQDYYYQHPSPSSHILGGRSESLMRVLEESDDTVIRGRRLRMHHHLTADNSPSTPLLITSTSKLPPVEEKLLEFNFEYLEEKKQSWSERLDITLHICRRPFFYLCSCIGLVTNLPAFSGPEIQNRVICLGVSLIFLIGHLTYCIRDAHKKQYERGLWSFVIGWILIVNIRLGYCSLNPLFIGERTWKISLLSLIFCLAFALVSLTEEVIVFLWRRWILQQEQEESEDNQDQERYEIDENEHVTEVTEKRNSRFQILYSALSRGVSFGCLLFITHWLFTSGTTLVRWSGFPGFPCNLFIVIALNLGLILANVTLILRSIIGFIVMLSFAFMLSYIPTNDTTYSILILMASIVASLVLPSIWIHVLIRKHTGYSYAASNLSAALCCVTGLFIYIFQVVLLEFSTPSSNQDSSVTWMRFIRKEAHALLIFSCVIIATFGIGLGNIIRRPVLGRKQDPLSSNPFQNPNDGIVSSFFKWFIRDDGKKKVRQSPFMHIDKRVLTVVIIVCCATLFPSLGYRFFYAKAPINQYKDEIALMTFNVHNGYDLYGRNNFKRVLEILKQGQATVIGLQQSDTNRISASNNDLLEYLSFYLNMYEYYGPSLREGSFGCSILSAYPLEDRAFYLLPSNESEQAVMVKAYIRTKDFDSIEDNDSTNTSLTDFYFFSSSFSVRNKHEQYEQAQHASRILESVWSNYGIRDRTFETFFLVGDLNLASSDKFFNESHLTQVISNPIVQTNASSNFTTVDYISMSVREQDHARYMIINSTILPIDQSISYHSPLVSWFKAIKKPKKRKQNLEQTSI